MLDGPKSGHFIRITIKAARSVWAFNVNKENTALIILTAHASRNFVANNRLHNV